MKPKSRHIMTWTDKFKASMDTDFLGRFEKCNLLHGKERNTCLYPLLHDVTKLQDLINLSLDVSVNFSTQLARNMVNDANAIILGVSSKGGDIRPVLLHGYVDEKINKLVYDWNSMAHDYNITVDDPAKFIPKKKLTSFIDRTKIADKKTRDWHRKYLFG